MEYKYEDIAYGGLMKCPKCQKTFTSKAIFGMHHARFHQEQGRVIGGPADVRGPRKPRRPRADSPDPDSPKPAPLPSRMQHFNLILDIQAHPAIREKNAEYFAGFDYAVGMFRRFFADEIAGRGADPTSGDGPKQPAAKRGKYKQRATTTERNSSESPNVSPQTTIESNPSEASEELLLSGTSTAP